MKTNEKSTAIAVQESKTNEVVTATVITVAPAPTKGAEAVNLPADSIEPSNYNARKTFDPVALDELAQNIKTHGLIQPITVRKRGEGYEIICGERRFRACRMLAIAEIPCLVRDATDAQAYDLSISENLQREDVPPMEAAEAYKRLINTKRYDVPSLALQFGKSEKTIYNTLKLCDLVPGIAKLVREGKLSASAGIVINKYDKKIQEEILKDRLGTDGRGEWCQISAGTLVGRIESCYTNKLEDYGFDKAKCHKCPHNSNNFDLFAVGGGCGRCTNEKCLREKNTAYLVAQAEAVSQADPKLVFIGDQYSRGNDATQKVRKGGYEFKNVQTYNMGTYPTAPVAPDSRIFNKSQDFDKAVKQYEAQKAQYDKKVAELDKRRDEGQIRVYAEIGDKAVKLRYKEVPTAKVKTAEQILADLTDKKKRNIELQAEKTAEGLKELLHTEAIPQSAFTPAEEQMMYFFMLSDLRYKNYKAIGITDRLYYLTDEKKKQIVASLTEQQKTVIRRDYLYKHLTERTTSVASVQGAMLQAFAQQHLPEQTAKIEATHREDYGRKNARLDERIAGLKKAEKNAKGEAKTKKADQPAPADKVAKSGAKQPKKADKPTPARKTVAPAKPEAEKVEPKAVNTQQASKAVSPANSDGKQAKKADTPSPTAVAVIPAKTPAVAVVNPA